MSKFIHDLGINMDDVLNLIKEDKIGDAFILCEKYLTYCWIGKGLNKRLLYLNQDEFMSEAYIAFHYSATKYDSNWPVLKAFLDYFYVNLERHLFYVSLDSNFVQLSKCYRARRSIDKVEVSNFADESDEEKGESSSGVILSLIANEDNHAQDIEDADLLEKLLENVQERDRELLLNPMEHPYEYFVGGGLASRHSVRGTKSNWIKKLRKISKEYI